MNKMKNYWTIKGVKLSQGDIEKLQNKSLSIQGTGTQNGELINLDFDKVEIESIIEAFESGLYDINFVELV